jgi:heme exporter protein B
LGLRPAAPPASGLTARPHLLLLSALLAGALPFAPLAAGSALRGAVE